MSYTHSTRAVLALAAMLIAAGAPAPHVHAQAAPSSTVTYTVFLGSRPIGQESISIVQQPDGWLLRGTGRLNAPLDLVTRSAEIHYDTSWRPTRLLLDTITRGQEVTIKTTFADGQASSEITTAGAGAPTMKVDQVAPDTLVLPNAFLSSYAALARRLVGQ